MQSFYYCCLMCFCIYFPLFILLFSYNNIYHSLVVVIGNSQGIWVPAVFVSKAAGETLKIYAQGQEGECCIINPSFPESAWTVMVISFISLLVIATVVLTFFLTRNRRLNQRGTNPHRPSVDAKLVEVLPCFTFSQACECRVGDTCSICLEDYKDGERLRVLPCQHGRTSLLKVMLSFHEILNAIEH